MRPARHGTGRAAGGPARGIPARGHPGVRSRFGAPTLLPVTPAVQPVLDRGIHQSALGTVFSQAAEAIPSGAAACE